MAGFSTLEHVLAVLSVSGRLPNLTDFFNEGGAGELSAFKELNTIIEKLLEEDAALAAEIVSAHGVHRLLMAA